MKQTLGKLILIRHGKAEPRKECPDDAQRKLTEDGIKGLEKILPGLKSHLAPVSKLRVISSPLPRAAQTAEIIAEYLGMQGIEHLDWVESGDYEGLRETIKGLEPSFSLAVVGHEPHLSTWSRQFSGLAIPFRKGSAVGFCVTSQESLHAQPEWMLLPETINPQNLNIRRNRPALPEFQKILRARFQAIFYMLQRFLDGPDDPETAHQFRVKIRALRSVLFFIKPLLDPEQYKTAQDRMKQLAQRMGRLREIDILKAEWMGFLKAYPQLTERQSVLTTILDSERQKEQAEICGEASRMTLPIFDTWDWAESACTPEAPLAGQAEKVIKQKTLSFASFSEKRRRNLIQKAAIDLKTLDCSDFSSIHALRIQFKKLRYTFSLIDPLLDMKRTETIMSLEALQDVFGDYCDAQRNLSLLKELSAGHDVPEMRYESATLTGYQIRKAEEKLRKIERSRTKAHSWQKG